MDTGIREIFERYHPLNEEEWQAFLTRAKTVKLKSRDIFLKDNEVANKIGFLKSGILRAYHLNDKGEDITSYFYYVPNRAIVALFTSFERQIPSIHVLEAINDCEIMYLERRDLIYLFDRYYNFEKLRRIVIETHYMEFSKRAQALQTMSAKELYKDFLKDFGDLVLQVPQHMIASYLGISQFTLSKIKNDL